VHFPFQPPKRHADAFRGLPVPKPASMLYKEDYYDQLPEWVKRRRYTRHGVDGLFGHSISYDEAYRGYHQCLKSVDDSVGEVLGQLENSKLLNDTLVIYMGDNGYMWGEHGLVDKRAMYEPSIRVPMIAHCPGLISGGRTVKPMALNLDIAPTLLEAAGIATPKTMHGRSLLPLMQGRQPEDWRREFIYEYEWEQDFPYTPTITGLRTERHSLMLTQGTFDIQELYDLESDPDQMKNLLADIRLRNRGRMAMNIPKGERRDLVDGLQGKLEDLLRNTGGDPRRAGRWRDSYSYAL
jgi:N-acetylglucosamine-6-sulfatase